MILKIPGSIKFISHRRSSQVEDNFPSKYVQCGSHFFLLYSRSPELLRTLAGLPSACGCGLAGDVLPKPCSLSDELDREKPRQDVGGVGHRELFSDTSVSRQHDTCIPTLSDLSCLCCSRKPPSRNFERFTGWRLPLFSGTVKL
jgi:hypothetical protein